MRLPAVAIAAAFSCGIALGLHPAVARNAASLLLLSSSFVTIAVLVLTGFLFVAIGRLLLAASASLLTWVLLGFLGVCIAEQPRDADHVISLVEQGRLPLKTPLRWHGHLRDEPTRLTWGFACALTIAVYPFGQKWMKGRLELSVLDVGQGDSLFVVSPGGRNLLIDGGGAFGGFPGHEEHNGVDPGEEAVSPYLWSRGFQKLDVVALTHAHQDHLGGLAAILDSFRVSKLWIGRELSSLALARLEELARQRKIPIEHELRGKSFSWDSVDGEFLWPRSAPGEIATSAKNNDSLVLRLHYGRLNILLPGDAEKQAEREILSENSAEELHSDVLKIGHHGSKNSTTPEFLAAVQPLVGIISAGEDNPYGHPSPELLERLENTGVRVLRTDRDGAVHVLTDGARLEITCFVACPGVANAAASALAKVPDHQQDREEK
jgi:DNA internalization-related competence protein ComEC/Rec2